LHWQPVSHWHVRPPHRRQPTELTLQLKWVAQAQFAGYFVALDKGFYEEEGLDVTIKPGGPDIAPEQVIAGGGADVIVDWMGRRAGRRAKRACRWSTSPSPSRRPAWKWSARRTAGADDRRFPGPHARRLVLRQRVSVLRMDEQARHSTEGGDDGVTVLKQSFDVSR
jgi:NitT/TauT family transport system substrate-binding protein